MPLWPVRLRDILCPKLSGNGKEIRPLSSAIGRKKGSKIYPHVSINLFAVAIGRLVFSPANSTLKRAWQS